MWTILLNKWINFQNHNEILFQTIENEIIIEQNIRILMYNVSDEEYKGRIKEFKWFELEMMLLIMFHI